jgi:hypothetical protein
VTRLNFREIRDRFNHIDATFESSVISMPGDSHYAVRFYPWWEHPSFGELAASGGWRAQWPSEAEKVVTVYPVDLIAACVRRTEEVVDWKFVDSAHPLLWPFEPYEDVQCKAALPSGALIQLPALIDAALPYEAGSALLAGLLNPVLWRDRRIAESGRGGFSLGRFPASVVAAVRSVLDEFGIGYLQQEALTAPEPLPVMLVIDGDDYLIAADLEVDVPEFEHNPDWVASQE